MPDTERHGPFTLGGVRLLYKFLEEFIYGMRLFHFYGQGYLALIGDLARYLIATADVYRVNKTRARASHGDCGDK